MNASTGIPVASLRNVVLRYGSVEALNIPVLDLQVGVTGLVGVNGAGKTSLMKLLTGLVRASTGSIRMFGQDLTPASLSATRARIGLAPQGFTAPAHLCTSDLVAYLAWLHGVPAREVKAASSRALALVDLQAAASVPVKALSGGMVRRVAVAQAIAHDPSLLLLDEPTTGLDPEQRHRVRALVESVTAGRSVIVSSHIMEDVVRMSDRVLLLAAGRVRFHGTLDQFWSAAHARGVNAKDAELAFLALAHGDGSL